MDSTGALLLVVVVTVMVGLFTAIFWPVPPQVQTKPQSKGFLYFLIGAPPWVKALGRASLWFYVVGGLLVVVLRNVSHYVGVLRPNAAQFDDFNINVWFWVCVAFAIYRCVKRRRAQKARARRSAVNADGDNATITVP